jgi:hypothetical protein
MGRLCIKQVWKFGVSIYAASLCILPSKSCGEAAPMRNGVILRNKYEEPQVDPRNAP